MFAATTTIDVVSISGKLIKISLFQSSRSNTYTNMWIESPKNVVKFVIEGIYLKLYYSIP